MVRSQRARQSSPRGLTGMGRGRKTSGRTPPDGGAAAEAESELVDPGKVSRRSNVGY